MKTISATPALKSLKSLQNTTIVPLIIFLALIQPILPKEDKLDEIEWKMKCMDGILFFVCLGMESYYEEEVCYELNTIQVIQEYLNTLWAIFLALIQPILPK